MPSVNDLVVEIRGRLGDPSEAELPSDQIASAVEGAVREFSRYRPVRSEVSVTLQPGVAEYDLPAGVIGVSESARENHLAIAPFGFELERPSNVEDYDFWRRFASDTVGQGAAPVWELDVVESDDEGQSPLLLVSPVPVLAARLALVVEKVRDVAKLTRTEVEGIVQWAVGDCMEFRGRKRSKSVTKIPTATGRLELDDGEKLRLEGAEVKCKQEGKWGKGAAVVEAG